MSSTIAFVASQGHVFWLMASFAIVVAVISGLSLVTTRLLRRYLGERGEIRLHRVAIIASLILPLTLPRPTALGEFTPTEASTGTSTWVARNPVEPPPSPGQPIWPAIAVVVWGLGVATGLARIAAAALRVRRSVGNTHDPATSARLEQVGVRGRRWRVRLATCDSPFLTGVIRPVLTLPTHAKDWSETELSAIGRHEQAHLENHDLLFRRLAHGLVILNWINPLAWLLAARHRLLGELLADRAALDSGIGRGEYARLLVAHATPTEMSAALGQAPLLTRVEYLVTTPDTTDTTYRTLAVLVIWIGLVGFAWGSLDRTVDNVFIIGPNAVFVTTGD